MRRARKPARAHAPGGGPLERQARASLRAAGSSMARLEGACARAVAAAAEVVVAALQGGGTVFFCGNGGSAADAQHLAAELAGRYGVDRPGLAAVALSTNSSSLTAIANDLGFDQVFARQLEGLGSPGDVLVAITTSGRSRNVLKAVETARSLGIVVIGFTGEDGAELARRCDHALVTPSSATPRIQEGHIVMGHVLCELVERTLFGGGARGRRRVGVHRRRDAVGARSRRRGRS